MNPGHIASLTACALILVRWAAELGFSSLNRRHVLAHSNAVPEPLRGVVDEPTYARSVEYTMAKDRFSSIETTWSTLVLLVTLFSGVLPWGYKLFTGWLGASAGSQAAFFFVVVVALAIPGLPFDWYSQFKLEDRFGFNTTTLKTWWLDRLKGALLAMALGCPLLALVLKLVEWTGERWWLWAWACVLGFQLLMVVLAPVLILPLFNKFTPLPEGPLRERLLALGRRTAFAARSIQVMDGSKRSRHSNAFFTGFGRFRKIVLFDTLIGQLAEPELEAVLAHEVGHCKKRHVPKMLAWSAAGLIVSLYAVAWLAKQDWFYDAFGFPPDDLAPALLVFVLLYGAVTFWISPLQNFWSRRFEYQADAFAAATLGESRSLTGALRKLNEKNLSNLTPHPLYSGFHYSHPTLMERERALARTSH
ncbi:MAG TPA: M48 family metallopeptidase [Candidatus Angelobacter sp.]|nr:M48 family metallopeptidase [Candidatus Angelobacter sp.]